jgi:hypothetical protein
MSFTGKRTERIRLPKQLRYPSDLAWQVRAMAQMNNRPIENQILHLVIQGIRFEELSKGESVVNSQALSQRVIRFEK